MGRLHAPLPFGRFAVVSLAQALGTASRSLPGGRFHLSTPVTTWSGAYRVPGDPCPERVFALGLDHMRVIHSRSPQALMSHPLLRVTAHTTSPNRTTRPQGREGFTVDRDKALEMALSQIDKQFGKGSIMKLGERGNVGVEAIPTGALALDLALGIGGLPRGRIVEIFGPESSGKSTLATHVVAEAQRNGGVCAYIDAEHAMDPVYARAIGVNVDELLISQPDTGEQALEIADMLIRSGAIDVLVVDSVAALTPRAEIEGEMGDSHVGLQARLMSQALRKLTGTLSKTNTIAIFINQLREKIGVMYGCLSWDTLITLADGTQIEIGNIVNQKLPVEVLTWNPDSGDVEARKVVG